MRTGTDGTPATTWTGALAQASARRPKRVIGAWLAAVALAVVAIGGFLGGALTSDDDFTGAPESSRAHAMLDAAFPAAPDEFGPDEAVIVRASSRTVDDPAFRRRVEALSARLRELGDGKLADTMDFYASGDRALVGRDRRATAILVDLEGPVEPVAELVASAGGGGFDTYLIGDHSIDADFERAAEEDLQKGEIFGLGIALVILLAVFGTVVASLIPIAMAIAAIVVALGCVAVIGQVAQLSFFVVNLLVMMGLAVGIDYSLFVVSRVREERREGRPTLDAVAVAGATASRAVVFSGITVVLALVGMFLVPQTLFRSLATGAIIVVLISVLAALTLLPAVLGSLGDRVDALPLRRRAHRRPASGRTLSDRVAAAVLRRPRASLAAGTLALLLMAAPYLAMSTGSAGVGTLPESFPTKQAYTVLSEQFPGQGTADAEVAVSGDLRSAPVRAAVADLRAALERDADFGAPAVAVAPDRRHARITVRVAGDALAPRAIAAVRRLRDQHIPQAFGGVPATALVGGDTAGEIDFFDIAARYQPIVVGVVLALSFALLVVAFRSLVVPAVAIAMNLLSVGAAYGLLVLVFQEGIGAGLLGFQASDTVEAWLPLFLFTVLFGLSMDYQVFLMSRIRERYDETRDTGDAVGFGLRSTARLITGAALIMVAVFAGFAGGQLVMFQQMGFGLGIAVLLDATVVRCVLVPAAMHVLGRANWYLPARLGWVARLSPETA
jgi:RND superfamily putative drug exporter